MTLKRLPTAASTSKARGDSQGMVLATPEFLRSTVSTKGGAVPATRLLAMLADAYRRQKFPGSPELARSGIAVVDSDVSFLVQAADVLGNFSMNYIIRNSRLRRRAGRARPRFLRTYSATCCLKLISKGWLLWAEPNSSWP